MSLATNLPRCGSALSIYRYDGDGKHVPVIAWLQDEYGEFWKFEFNCPSEMDNIPPDDFEDQRQILAKQRTPEMKPRANEPQHFANTSSWQWEPWHDTRRHVPQAYGSQWEAQKAGRSDTWKDKWPRKDTIAWMRGQKPGTVELPRLGSTVKIHKYIGEGNLVPTIAWLKDENDQLWMVQLQRQAQLTDILPHKCYQNPGKELFSQNGQQQKLDKEKPQKSNDICQSFLKILEKENCKFEMSTQAL